ncbi:mucoidy inhibitor MuiA family protein [Mucilaginibacter agri]|uniref:Mucoidy inhibitor MuiA family protein n=1 Tax=Mucilaginibacter agri TaxID=2695265 RepID=A0A965ZCJ7_9SPHI|nr:mucoidy inhibitor MuiA family protein [Mucilaginibacter agri]NCD68508.1 mucoidy inhibitor MuiA family protein [Mucilaginibacter agri]
MTRKLLLITFCSLFTFLTAQASDQQKVSSKIQHVVVFLNGAQVTRNASVSIPAGNSVVSFGGISPDIDMQSLQIKSGGDFTILSVNHEFDYLNKQVQQKHVEELLAQQKLIRDKIDLQSNALNVYTEEQNMLLKNQTVSGQNANLDVLRLKQALDFQTLRLTEIKKKEQSVNDEIALLNKQLQQYNKQIAEVNKGGAKPTSNILVTVSAKAASQSAFTFTYVVKNASWYPTYDIRAKNINSPIQVAYKANVAQQCGEDWNNIKLTLSTGNPSVNGSKPELTPNYLNMGMMYADKAASITNVTGRVCDEQGQGLPGVAIKIKGSSIGTVADQSGFYSVQIPQGGQQVLVYSFIGYQAQELPVNSTIINTFLTPAINQLNEVAVVGYGTEAKRDVIAQSLSGRVGGVYIRGANLLQTTPVLVQQNENQTNVEFNIDNPYSIPSDGKQYLVEINQVSIPADYEYFTAPKLSTDVFLTAKLANWNQYSFLSGEANLFFEGTFIGKSLLDTRSTADTLNLSLGVDKSIIVTRELQTKVTERQSLLGSNKKETRDWLITVKNRKSQPVNLLVQDQVPVSQNSSIEVETQNLSGGKTDANTGLVSWNVNLNPQNDKKLNLKYQVKYPKSQSVIVQ